MFSNTAHPRIHDAFLECELIGWRTHDFDCGNRIFAISALRTIASLSILPSSPFQRKEANCNGYQGFSLWNPVTVMTLTIVRTEA
jgi:hypothetical protein